MGLILGVDSLIDMFEEKYYRNLNGGIMEAFGIIFTRDIPHFYTKKPKINPWLEICIFSNSEFD